VRDGLSLLDQAIALSGRPRSSEAAVRDMLGIADRNLVFDLFETVMQGDAKSALQQIESLYQGGADPLMVMQDLLDLTHFVTGSSWRRRPAAATPRRRRPRARPARSPRACRCRC
jgi:DNA polymerase-3 subunit gamma/tau